LKKYYVDYLQDRLCLLLAALVTSGMPSGQRTPQLLTSQDYLDLLLIIRFMSVPLARSGNFAYYKI